MLKPCNDFFGIEKQLRYILLNTWTRGYPGRIIILFFQKLINAKTKVQRRTHIQVVKKKIYVLISSIFHIKKIQVVKEKSYVLISSMLHIKKIQVVKEKSYVLISSMLHIKKIQVVKEKSYVLISSMLHIKKQLWM